MDTEETKKLTPQKVKEILRRHGQEVTIEHSKWIADFMALSAKITVQAELKRLYNLNSEAYKLSKNK